MNRPIRETPRAVDYGFRPGRTPLLCCRVVKTPPRARRPRPALPTSAISTVADPPAGTVPHPSDNDNEDAMGPHFILFTPSPGNTPTAPARSDALDDAAELRVADSVARHSRADWKRGQHAEPTCHATIRKSFSAGLQPSHPTSWRSCPRTTVLTCQTSRICRIGVDYTQATTTP